MGYGLLKRVSWLVIALTSVCIGLNVVGVNVEMMLHLEGFDQIIRYAVGCLGAGSLVMFFVERSMGNCCKS